MENMILKTEDGHGVGAIRPAPDPRDFKLGEQIGLAPEPFDWSKGFDIEEELQTILKDENFRIKSKDQDGSGSCGGQAWAYYGAVISAFNNGIYDEKSAKFIYSQTFVLPAGSDGRTNSNLVKSKGWGNESDTVSYENRQPPGESFMQRKDDITPEAFKRALKDRALAYAFVDVNIEAIAAAIRDRKGVILGITGTNNGTWRSAFPLPPKVGESQWYHWIYAGKARIINGKKYIGFKNSWGDSTGEKGWQWIGEDYFTNNIPDPHGGFSIWTPFVLFYNKSGDLSNPSYIFQSVLRFGSKGGEVKKLQYMLDIKDDGIFGKNTLAAVKKFQSENNLVTDGIVGILTQTALKNVHKL